MLLTLTVTINAWGAETEIAKFESDVVVTQSSYASYSTNDWTLSKGGNSYSCGFNKNNKTTISNAYGTKATTSHHGYTIVSKNKLDDVDKITFTFTAHSSNGTPKLYIGYSTDGNTWKEVPLKSGNGLSSQGVSANTDNTVYTFEFTASIPSAYYAIVHSASQELTTASHLFRYDYVTAVFYKTQVATQLEKPTNLKVSNVTTTSATLSWDAVTNASGYTVTVGSTTHSANTNFISLNNLTPSTTYKWSVVAKGNGSTYTDSESANGSDFTTDTPKKYTVTWMVDKEKLSTEDVYEDGKVSTVPTVTELPCGDKFVGWTTEPITTPQNKAPEVFTTVAGSPTITKATTFYAVFADYADQ